LSTALITLRGLERPAAVSRAVYEAFLNRVKVTEQVGFNEAESWILSPAIAPANPSFPNPLLFLGATLFLASAAALSLALLAEREAGQTILSSQHILDRGLKPLGIVPDCGNGTASLKRALAASTQRENSAFPESIGAIFTSLMELGRRERSSLVLLVTSALPFEGKSTTIVALAAKMASAGKRILVIDADLRAPRLHHAFGISNKHGLTECLDSSRPLGDSIYRDAETGISVLTAGPSRPKPQNVLRSQQLFDAVETFRTSYDFILIDSPPVLPFSDARILVPLTDYCIFVMHWGKTRWTSGMHALRLLRDSEARLAGIVVSKVNVKKLATYEFADSEIYGRAYKRYSAGTVN
jgi:polysaccharide biosynthesis transport protein